MGGRGRSVCSRCLAGGLTVQCVMWAFDAVLTVMCLTWVSWDGWWELLCNRDVETPAGERMVGTRPVGEVLWESREYDNHSAGCYW